MAGIYLHIPFCKQACYYCNFHFSTSTRYKEPMVKALKQELRMRKDYLGEEAVIKTIYLGGGTPSLLACTEVAGLLDHIKTHFTCSEEMEVTLEANPDDLSLAYLRDVRRAGVNRLSIGIQSFDKAVLASLNRAHNDVEALACIAYAREAGFSNFSIDLMYGLPARKKGGWEQEVAQAIELGPTHISAYCLTIEPRTVFGHRRQQGTFVPVAEEVQIAEFLHVKERLTAHGYVHYEISNFCRPPYYAQHNTSYWQRTPYLGVGPSAHSYDGRSRQYNIANNKTYIAGIEARELPCRKEVLTDANHINEHILLGLRTQWGVDTVWLKEQYDYDLLKESRDIIEKSLDKNLLVQKEGNLLLTTAGQLIADELALQLIITSY